MSKRSNVANFFIGVGIGLVIVVAVLIFLFSFGKFNFISSPPEQPLKVGEGNKSEEKKKSLKEQRIQLDTRYDEVQQLLNEARSLKIRLERRLKLIFFGVRLSLALLFLGTCYVFHTILHADWKDTYQYIEMGIGLTLVLVFVFFGVSTSLGDLWNQLRKTITLLIYKRYLTLDLEIANHSQELETIASEKLRIDEELKQLEEIDRKVTEVISHLN